MKNKLEEINEHMTFLSLITYRQFYTKERIKKQKMNIVNDTKNIRQSAENVLLGIPSFKMAKDVLSLCSEVENLREEIQSMQSENERMKNSITIYCEGCSNKTCGYCILGTLIKRRNKING